jgi:hypothetical protein
MGGILNLIYQPWWLLLYAIAIIHFVRRRPAGFWLWIILFLGPIGVVVYIVAEVIPDAPLLRQTFEVFPRRKRIRRLEAMIVDNPSAGNLEELGDLSLDDKNFKRALECYDRALGLRAHSEDAYYRRGIAKMALGDYSGAMPDLEYTVARDPKYDSYRAMGLLAHAYANTGHPDKAEACFLDATHISTLSETYLNFANFLASQNRNAEAREWAQRILQKKPNMPNYLRRRERPWFRRASALLKKLPA